MSNHEHSGCANDAAIAQITANVSALQRDMQEMVQIQQRVAEDVAEGARKTADQIHALAIEIERQKTNTVLSTGDQRAAIERLNSDRRESDVEMRAKISRYEAERGLILAAVDKANAELASISKRLAEGDKRIEKGEQAWTVLKWVGMVIGALIITALISRVILNGGATIPPPVKTGEKEPLAAAVGATSYLMAKIWAGFLSVSGVVLMALKSVAYIRVKLQGGV